MISVPEGKYIVAVSGGVDSMALLDMLCGQEGLQLVVAHANHGIRPDSGEDEVLVATFCTSHNTTFISKKLHLKPDASEAGAREARYSFLQQCRISYNADAIITAHHQDDLLETVLINLLRGTGWRGLAPFVGSKYILRPLLGMNKSDLQRYAADHSVPWREDSTNSDQHYLRNYVRQTVRPALTMQTVGWEQSIMRLVRNQQYLRRKIDGQLNQLLTDVGLDNEITTSSRYFWIMLPGDVAYELLQAMCRRLTGHSLVASLAQDALIFAKAAKAGKSMTLNSQWQLRVTPDKLIVEPRPSVVS